MGKILCIGVGAMGGAVVRGALGQGIWKTDDLLLVVHSQEHAQALSQEFGIPVYTSIPDLSQVGTVLLGVKPQVLPDVLPELTGLAPETPVISMAAGIPLATLEGALPQAAWYRVMPNTPASVGKGVMPNTPASVGKGLTAIALGSKATQEGQAQVEALFNAVGDALVVSEADLDRIGALAGSGPGYLMVVLDALADAGVRIGLKRDVAIRVAKQTLYGSGAWAVASDTHPAVLRDQVTSPGGTTIAGIAAMEKGGLRSAIQDGVVAAMERTKELGS
ncbi:MAG: pyrroline-5-carboxylate reductase [Veillonella sp.]|nr:pyrroline-5-carboxylate reductase [Veillonella sp.]